MKLTVPGFRSPHNIFVDFERIYIYIYIAAVWNSDSDLSPDVTL